MEEHFHNRLNVIKVLSGYEVDEKILENVDYVLSTVPLKNVSSDKIIRINRMLQKEDVENIENRIFHKTDTDLIEITTFLIKIIFILIKILKQRRMHKFFSG